MSTNKVSAGGILQDALGVLREHELTYLKAGAPWMSLALAALIGAEYALDQGPLGLMALGVTLCAFGMLMMSAMPWIIAGTSAAEVEGKPLYQPYLADESANLGALFGLSLIVDDIEFGVTARWLERDAVTLHHSGDQLLPRRRERPDGTFDDSGVTYTELDQDRLTQVSTRGRGSLFVGELYGSYRTPIPFTTIGRFSGYAPLGAGVALMNVQEPNRPLAVALQAHAGLGAMYQFSDSLALSAVGKMYGLASFEYTNSSDAARRAVEAGAGTADALFSTMVSAAAHISLVFIVR